MTRPSYPTLPKKTETVAVGVRDELSSYLLIYDRCGKRVNTTVVITSWTFIVAGGLISYLYLLLVGYDRYH